MKTICIAGLKGGIGKTTTATSLAYLLANEQDKKVLLVDADSQGNASMTFGVFDDVASGMVPVMAQGISESIMSPALEQVLDDTEYTKPKDLIKKSEYGVDVLTANGYLDLVNALLTIEKTNDQIFILKSFLESVAEEYDFCVIDCGLKMDITVINAVLAADLIISPMRLGGYELNASEIFDNQIFDLRELNPDVEVYALITCFQKSKTTTAIEENLRDRYLDETFDTHIRNSVVVMGKSFMDGPLPANSRNSNPCAALPILSALSFSASSCMVRSRFRYF